MRWLFCLLLLGGCRAPELSLPEVAGPPRAPSIEAGPSFAPEEIEVPEGFVHLPAGDFVRGVPAQDDQENPASPAHEVRITRDFFLARTEVTVAQFRAFVEATAHETDAEKQGEGGVDNGHAKRAGITWSNPPFPQEDDHPVIEVSWRDAVAYADWRSAQDGLKRCYAGKVAPIACSGWRLPTEAEWEWAARGAGKDAVPGVSITRFGCEPDPALAAIAWTCANSGNRTHPVASLAADERGLHDLHGNVWEWVHDWYDDYGAAELIDPTGPRKESDKVIRGGGWGSRASDVSATARADDPPDAAFDNLGFRLARTVSP